GVELLGAETAEADAEMVLMAVDALAHVGIAHMAVDLTVPLLVPSLGPMTPELRQALDGKDAAAGTRLGGPLAALLATLLASAGAADSTLTTLKRMDLPEKAAAERERLSEVVGLIRADAPGLTLTIDPVENRGFAYHTGVSFTVFAPGVRGELGSGGRYGAVDGTVETAGPRGEPATGFTLYIDTMLRVLPAAVNGRSVYLPLGTSGAEARGLRAKGWTTIRGLTPAPDTVAEARRLGCTHAYIAGR